MSERLYIINKERKRYKQIYSDSDTSGFNWSLEKGQMTYKQKKRLLDWNNYIEIKLLFQCNLTSNLSSSSY